MVDLVCLDIEAFVDSISDLLYEGLWRFIIDTAQHRNIVHELVKQLRLKMSRVFRYDWLLT